MQYMMTGIIIIIFAILLCKGKIWKSQAGVTAPPPATAMEDDDWETDPDFINDVTEEEQRWGSRTVPGSGRTGEFVDMKQLIEDVAREDALKKKQELEQGPKASYGYGGKFGVQSDRMDKSAMGHDYIGKVAKHASQTDYSTGFGGKFGVQKDRIDKSAATYEHKEKLEKHASQKDYAEGFGGRFGVQRDRQDKSAVGWDHKEMLPKHESQKDYAVGFGGKFGVQRDRQDKCALGYDHTEKLQKHQSQIDHNKGFGGKFGLEADRVDKAAHDFEEKSEKIGTNYEKVKVDIGAVKSSSLRAKFENMARLETVKAERKKEMEQERRRQKEAQDSNADKERERLLLSTLQQKENSDVKMNAENKSGRVPVNEEQDELFHLENEFEVDVNTAEAKVDVPVKRDFTEAEKNLISNWQNSPLKNEVETNMVKEEGETKKKKVEEKEERELSAEKERDLERNEMEQQKILKEKMTEVQKSELKEKEAQLAEELDEINEYEHFEQEGEPKKVEEENEGELEDTGYRAIALYDYQASADDEISFDPDDTITHIEMIDEGWWRGLCRGQYGLFPANYVALL